MHYAQACRKAGITIETVPGVTGAGRIEVPGDEVETQVA